MLYAVHALPASMTNTCPQLDLSTSSRSTHHDDLHPMALRPSVACPEDELVDEKAVQDKVKGPAAAQHINTRNGGRAVYPDKPETRLRSPARVDSPDDKRPQPCSGVLGDDLFHCRLEDRFGARRFSGGS